MKKILLFVCLSLSAYSAVGQTERAKANFYFQPLFLPIKIVIDDEFNFSIETTDLTRATPIGIFGVNVEMPLKKSTSMKRLMFHDPSTRKTAVVDVEANTNTGKDLKDQQEITFKLPPKGSGKIVVMDEYGRIIDEELTKQEYLEQKRNTSPISFPIKINLDEGIQASVEVSEREVVRQVGVFKIGTTLPKKGAPLTRRIVITDKSKGIQAVYDIESKDKSNTDLGQQEFFVSFPKDVTPEVNFTNPKGQIVFTGVWYIDQANPDFNNADKSVKIRAMQEYRKSLRNSKH